jgi:predicted DNA binding CopG/RHH family protein
MNMPKTKMKQVVIPKFSSEAEEATWWETHRPEIEAEIRKRIKKKKPLTLDSLLRGATPSQPVTLRVSQEDLEMARRLAARRGLGYQTYIKMLLRNALSEDSAEGVVNDLCSYAEVQTSFQYWSNAESLTVETQMAIQRSDIVLVPAAGFGDYTEPVFPKGTDELFQFLCANAPSGIKVELAAEDEDYKELALHADVVYIATVLVRLVVAPLAIGLIVEHLKNRLGSRLGKTEVRASMILDQTDGPNSKTLKLSYEGPAIAFEKTMREALSSVVSGTRTPDHEVSGEKTHLSGNERK